MITSLRSDAFSNLRLDNPIKVLLVQEKVWFKQINTVLSIGTFLN